MPRKQSVVRLTEEQDKMLDELSNLTNQSRNDVITALIIAEYDKINGNPEAKKLFEQFKFMQEQMQLYVAGISTNDKKE